MNTNEAKMRNFVYDTINGERDYQDSKWPGHNHSNVEWLVYIDDYVKEALHMASRYPDDIAERFLKSSLRKIGAMSVAAMEQNGVVTRKEEGPRPIGATHA